MNGDAIILYGAISGCAAFAAFIIWTAWPRRSKRVTYDCPMPWQQEEHER